MDIVIRKDSAELSARAAALFADTAREAAAERGQFVVALAGGSTPQALYALLAQPPFADAIPWDKTFVFMSDERCVPFDDKRSNFGAARQALLSRVPVPAGNIYPPPTDTVAPEQVAARYTQTLADFFGIDPTAPPPAFDLVLLGLGDDGHTASLFPGHPALEVQDTWVVSSPPGTLPPPVDRITFTLPLINAAHQVLFLVAGANKAEAVQDVLEGSATVDKRPAAGVHPASGRLTWLLDEPAASLLTRGNPT